MSRVHRVWVDWLVITTLPITKPETYAHQPILTSFSGFRAQFGVQGSRCLKDLGFTDPKMKTIEILYPDLQHVVGM